MGEVEEETGADVESDSARIRSDPWIPGFPGIAEEDDAYREQAEYLLLEEPAPLHVEECAPGSVKVVGVPTAQTEIGAESQLSVTVEVA